MSSKYASLKYGALDGEALRPKRLNEEYCVAPVKSKNMLMRN